MRMDEQLIQVGERKIFVSMTDDSGPAVILLHGGGPGASGMSAWQRNVDALAKHFRVIVADLPGYGRSSKDIDQADPFGSLASGISGLIGALGLPTAHLIGSSYGGAAALRLALDEPGLVDRMVLCAPAGIGVTRALPTVGVNQLFGYYTGSGPSREKMAQFMRESLVADGSAITDEMLDLRYHASLDPEVIANPPLSRPSGRYALRKAWRMDLTRDPRLSDCRTPTLAVWGTADRVNRPSGAWRLAHTMRACDAYLANGLGHWIPWESPELFNQLAINFLSSGDDH